MRLKHKLKQFTAIALSCLSVVSTPLTAYAVGGNTGAGDNEGIHGGYGSDMGSNRPNSRLGFRVSLVDRNDPTKVISVDDNGNPLVVDFLLTSEERFKYYTGFDKHLKPVEGVTGWRSSIKYVGKGSRMQGWKSPENGVLVVPEEDYLQYFDKEVDQWNKSEGSTLYAGNGTEFKDWFTQDKYGNEHGNTIWGGVAGGVQSTLMGERLDVTTSYKDVSGNPIKFSTNVPAIKSEQDINLWLDSIAKHWNPSVEAFAKDELNFTQWDTSNPEVVTQVYAEYIASLNELAKNMADSNEIVAANLERIESKLADILEGMGVDGKVKMSSNSIIDSITSLGMIEAYAAESKPVNPEIGSDNDKSETSTEGFTKLASEARIKLLLTMKGDTKTGRLFQTASMLEKAENPDVNPETNDVTNASEQWYAIVEPLYYSSFFAVDDDSKPRLHKFYGTLTNLYRFVVEEPDFVNAFGAKALDKVANNMNWKFMNAAGSYASIVLENPVEFKNGMRLEAPSGLGATATFRQLYQQVVLENKGYACHIYDKGQFGDTNQTCTWDYMNHKNDIGPSPDESASSESDWNFTIKTPDNLNPTDENLEKQFVISKFYYIKNPLHEYTLTDVETREETLHNVQIMDEGTVDSDFAYRVVGWACGKDKVYPDSGDLSEGFNDYTRKNRPASPNHQGNGQDTLELDPQNELDKKEQVLYVMLVREKVEKDEVDIVRVYETPNQTPVIEVEPNVKVENNTVDGNSPKPGFTYVENVNTSEPRKDITSWDEVPQGTGGRNPQIPVADTDKTIYIKYEEQVEGDPQATGLVLHENEISHQFTLSDVTGSLVEGVQNWSSVSSDASCPYSWTCSDDDCDGHTCGSSYDYTGSEDWSFGIENQPNYNTQFVYKWVQLEPKHWTGGGLSEGGGSGNGIPNMNMILQRTINDKVTLYPNMNSNKAALNDMGITSEGYIPANTRKDSLKDVPSRKSWTETFNTNFEFVDVNTPTATFESDHGYTDTDNHTDDGNNASSLNGTYSKSGNTTIYGLWGKENKGVAPLTDTAQQNIWKLSTLNFKGFKNHIKEQAFTFYPYYKMKFISQLDGAEQDAYLTAENLSTLLSLQRIDSSIFRTKGSVTLELTSSQWSTHAKAHNLLDAAGVENKNSLLPAGAIYDLRTAGNGVKASQSWIGYRVFNSYVMDKNALADATNVKTKQEVVDAVNAFKNDTKNVLSNYEVVMVGQEGINPDDNNGEFYRGSEVITGKDGSYRLGQEFIRDSKYDLQTTGSASGNSSDIDVLEELEETYDWVLTSDADGNVVITRNGTELERLQKNQKNLTNAEVKEFDSRTNIVTNFLSAIDRNMGSDRNGKTWYNEGFSIGCLETRLAYRMGFGDGDASLRSTALNIKANGKLENRNDMFNGDEAKNRSYQFFTSARSTLNGCEKDYVGTYDGIKIFIPNMNQLLVSNRFYTSNTTVMDLN